MSHQINITALADAIQRRREAHKLTVRAAAAQLDNVSSSTLSRIERGSLPDIDTYMTLCHWLGVSPAHFATTPSAAADVRESSLSKEDIVVHLRADKLLNSQTREALITMIEVAYAAARRNLLPNEAHTTPSGVQDPC
ncbi:helix-turn-helix domain-containing protein [Hymenobacter sp. NST-14]|uniref:helix-turn-helix domain-containing protein n=1 Tax=Hymenobacter piscis TaxID=2839984 RepID=UPI001C032BCC|nr:helix-turn-helix transcriptional regulator [Hymenobacter piscis]MBT9391779.1 helix-turn-helix domain-containing protein [Hymenobacter piscis]